MPQTLEQITEKTFNQKPSFFQRIRNSLASRLAVLISAGTFASAGCGENENFNTFIPPPPSDSITKHYQGGIPISSGKTNSEGEIQFEEGSRGMYRDVNILVENENEQLVNNAQVTYFDGNDFECFQVNHYNYTPQLECFAHNSAHTLSLTTSPLQVLHHENYEKKSAAINYANWAESNWEYLGCRNKTQLEAMMTGGSYIIKLLSKIFTLGFSDSHVDEAYDYLKEELNENDAGHIYFFNPSEHGFYATSSIWTIDFKTKETENCYDALDNDCDGGIDSEDGDCNAPSCYDECSPLGYKTCNGNGWKECGNYDSDACLEWSSLHACASDEYCENGMCTADCLPSTEVCNGEDDNCDSQIDESLIQACYTACGQGLEWCIGGTWQNCNAPQPSTEVCDRVDNDCDGQIDEDNPLNGCTSNEFCDNGECKTLLSSCEEVFICAKQCTGSGCGADCYAHGTAEAQGDVDDLLNCLDAICGSNECLFDAQRNECYTEWMTCFSCLDDCIRNQEQCFGYGWKDCGDYDTDFCSEWGPWHECSYDQYCQYGECRNIPTCIDNDGDGYGTNCSPGTDCNDSNRTVHPGAAEVLNGLDDNCNSQIDEGFVNTGDPQVTLFWNNAADLDLHVYAPDGCHVYYGNRNCGSGHLDRDANGACLSGAEDPPENIYWDESQAPLGTYEVVVKYFKECNNSGPTSYTVSISKNGNTTTTYNGTLNNEGATDTVTYFSN